ncbi:MAG: hypothetical protein Q8O67_00660 [Deltaproteobacteria bacterium]|nr:hypothetical protein [Deltaproteobacteria bacterium]
MRQRFIPVIVGLLATAACDTLCGGEDLQPLPAALEQPDVFTQKGAAQVDILWMIDNSGSMAAEQEKVAERFNQFFNQLIISQVDYHIGVITSDPDEGGVLRQYGGPAVQSCAACRFITKDVPCDDPNVDISTLNTEAEIEAKLAADCPAQLVFRKLIKVGIEGSSFEEGFTQAATALGARTVDPVTGFPDGIAPPENVDFQRADASLYIVFVSDEEEGAKQDGSPVRYYQRLFEGLKQAGNENNVAVAAITGYPIEDAPAPLEEVCDILATTFDNNPGNDDPRAATVKEALRNFRNGCLDVESTSADDAAFAELGGRYIELACRTGGVIANMCEADYTTALDALGANAAGLLRKFTISLPDRIQDGDDCVLFGADADLNVDCNGNGKQDDEGIDGPMCVSAQCIGDAAPTLQPRGSVWEWEDSTSSVRFGGSCIPAPNTEVIITYGLRPEGANPCAQ